MNFADIKLSRWTIAKTINNIVLPVMFWPDGRILLS